MLVCSRDAGRCLPLPSVATSRRYGVPVARPTWLDALDVAVYALVIALFVQVLPQVISESFPLTVLTAVMLKIVLEVVLALKKRIVGQVRSAQTPRGRFGSAALLAVLMPGSKFVVIELTALLFGDAVKLGGFWAVTGLAITLTLVRLAVRRTVNR